MIPACSVRSMYMALMCTVVRAGNLWALIILSASISACVVSKVTNERGASKEGRKEDQVLVQFRLSKDALSLPLLLGWTIGEGKCSSVTISLTQTESASVLHFVYTDLALLQ